MAIATLDALISAISSGRIEAFYKASGTSEAAGTLCDLFTAAGRPAAAAAPSVGLNGETLSRTSAGVIPFTDAAGALTKYLSNLAAAASEASSLLLYDRLWQNSGIVVTTVGAQAITPVAIPSRDANGAALGDGIQAYLEIYTATTNAGAVNNATISYTNTAGTAGRTGTITSIPATAVAGTMCQIQLQAGDTGIRSIESISLGTSLVSGAVGLVLLRPLVFAGMAIPNVAMQQGFDECGAKLWPGSALCLAVMSSTTVRPLVTGSLTLVEG